MIIGITGALGAGKDTVAQMIAKQTPHWVNYSWARPLKEFAEVVFDFPAEHLYGPSDLRSVQHSEAEEPEYWPSALARFWAVGGEFSREWLVACGRTPAGSNVGSAFVDWFDSIRRTCERDPSKFTPRYVLQQLGTEFGRMQIQDDVWIRVGRKRLQTFTGKVVTVPDTRFDNEGQEILGLGGEVWQVVRPGTAHSSHISEAGISSKFVTRKILNVGTLQDLESQVSAAFANFQGANR